jgi:tetratricopeptide (TPR) repeat protein
MDPLAEAKQLFLDALARHEKGDLEQAEILYRKALALAPDRPSVMRNLAVVFFQSGKFSEARLLCASLLEMDPDDAAALVHLGNCQLKLNSAEEALVSYEKALKLRPDDADALNNRGNALLELKRPEDALASYDRALAMKPDFSDALNNRGNALRQLKRPGEALASYDRALAMKPDFADALYNRGNALLELKRPGEALASYDRALAIKPDYADALNSRGNALLDLLRPEEAARCFERAIAVRPRHATAYCNLGVVLQEQGRWEEAVGYHERALDLDPGYAAAEYNLALACLFLQKFERAWPHYDRRLLSGAGIRESLRKDAATVERYERLPRWQGPGEALAGEVAIWGEQGIGDHVLFSTLIPELIAARVSFVYEVDRRLLAAYARAFPGSRFVVLEEPPREVLRRASRVLLAGSLPGLFRSSRESFARQPRRLLSALPERVTHYRRRMEAPGPGLKVAISWRSAREGRLGLSKSAALMEFAPLFELERVHFVDVQYGDTRAERQAVEDAIGVRLLHFDEVDYHRDLEEMLAILEACDLLITTSNVTAHLAGALGKPVWLLYPAERPPFHYWAHDGSHRCLWYPSVEIVSAPHFTEWRLLVEHAAERLNGLPGEPA